MLTRQPLRDLLDRFASADPTPGGGSASAVGAALGASLLLMVTRMPKTRSGSPADRAALGAAAAALTGIQQQLSEAVDADAAAYDQVVAAHRLPRATEVERKSRGLAVQRALRLATDVPLGVMRLSTDALKHAQKVAAHGHRAAASDVGVALALLQAGLEGARLNVRINLGNVLDRAYADAVAAESERLAVQTPGLVHEALAALE